MELLVVIRLSFFIPCTVAFLYFYSSLSLFSTFSLSLIFSPSLAIFFSLHPFILFFIAVNLEIIAFYCWTIYINLFWTSFYWRTKYFSKYGQLAKKNSKLYIIIFLFIIYFVLLSIKSIFLDIDFWPGNRWKSCLFIKGSLTKVCGYCFKTFYFFLLRSGNFLNTICYLSLTMIQWNILSSKTIIYRLLTWIFSFYTIWFIYAIFCLWYQSIDSHPFCDPPIRKPPLFTWS